MASEPVLSRDVYIGSGQLLFLSGEAWVNMFTHRESDVPRRGLGDGNHDV
jgi:hypothetical protein